MEWSVTTTKYIYDFLRKSELWINYSFNFKLNTHKTQNKSWKFKVNLYLSCFCLERMFRYSNLSFLNRNERSEFKKIRHKTYWQQSLILDSRIRYKRQRHVQLAGSIYSKQQELEWGQRSRCARQETFVYVENLESASAAQENELSAVFTKFIRAISW